MRNWKTRFPDADCKATLTFKPGFEINQQKVQWEIGTKNTILHYEQISARKVLVIWKEPKPEQS